MAQAQVPLHGDLRDVNIATVMSLKLKLKLELFDGKEEDWPMFANAFESALLCEGVPACMVQWGEQFDVGLRVSNQRVYDELDVRNLLSVGRLRVPQGD